MDSGKDMLHLDSFLELAEPKTLNKKHDWCLKYREFVLAGHTPSPEQDHKFMQYQRQTYEYLPLRVIPLAV